MIPSIARIRICRHGRDSMYWIPLMLVWILLIPLVLLLAIPLLIGCALCRVNPLRAAAVSWQLVSAARGTELDLTFPNASLSILVF